ncbi:MAG TPA: CarD family transcriptional regulator [Terriglobia bacterium]|nr:CarD family transcriptional regulator [Terriglobia bacterium]
MNFRVGEKVVYPTHGVGIIEQIHSLPASGSSQKFYLLRIYSNSLRVMVPFSNASSVGLRRIVNSQEMDRILRFLADGECLPAADWKCRYKENSEKMRSGSLLQVAEVLKCLLRVSKTKELSFRERKMLERARYLLLSELAIVKRLDPADAEAHLSKALAQAQLQFLPV